MRKQRKFIHFWKRINLIEELRWFCFVYFFCCARFAGIKGIQTISPAAPSEWMNNELKTLRQRMVMRAVQIRFLCPFGGEGQSASSFRDSLPLGANASAISVSTKSLVWFDASTMQDTNIVLACRLSLSLKISWLISDTTALSEMFGLCGCLYHLAGHLCMCFVILDQLTWFVAFS